MVHSSPRPRYLMTFQTITPNLTCLKQTPSACLKLCNRVPTGCLHTHHSNILQFLCDLPCAYRSTPISEWLWQATIFLHGRHGHRRNVLLPITVAPLTVTEMNGSIRWLKNGPPFPISPRIVKPVMIWKRRENACTTH